MARPKKLEEDKKIIRTYTVKRELHKEAADKAMQNDTTVSCIISNALKHYISN